MKTASLSSSLLVRKGAAAPSAILGSRPPPPSRPDHNGRVRLSVRFDSDQHLRLQLAAVHTNRSMRDLIATALDRYLDRIAPQVRQGTCACLGPGTGTG